MKYCRRSGIGNTEPEYKAKQIIHPLNNVRHAAFFGNTLLGTVRQIMGTFVSEKYGIRNELKVGQKVECIYYHEYQDGKDAYQRTWLSKFIDKPFKPVKFGVVIGDAGVHPYWLGTDGKEQYLFVKFKEYILPKPIPISCIDDALQSAERTLAMLERDKDKIGQKGYDIESVAWLEHKAKEALKFVGVRPQRKMKL